jgi:hypothetical protein
VEDLYATILYNDEVHTYEEVISTLQKAVLCDRKGCPPSIWISWTISKSVIYGQFIVVDLE